MSQEKIFPVSQDQAILMTATMPVAQLVGFVAPPRS